MNPTCGECREEIHEHASTCSRYPLNNVIARLKERAEKAEAERDAAQMGQRLGPSLRREVEAERDKFAAELEEAKAGLDRARKLVAEAWSGEGQGEQKPVSKIWLVRDPGEPWDGPYVMHRADDPAPVVPTGEPVLTELLGNAVEMRKAAEAELTRMEARWFERSREIDDAKTHFRDKLRSVSRDWPHMKGDRFEDIVSLLAMASLAAPAPVVAERKRVTTGRIVRLGRVSYLEKVGESPSRFGITTDRARAHRFLDDVRFVRLVSR